MKKFAAVALAVAALTLSACTPATSTPVAAPSPSQAAPSPSQAPISVPATVQAPALEAPVVTTSPAPCEEDEPCWDCATMGNMICGPVEAPAQAVQAVAPAPVFKGIPVTVNPVIPPHAEPAPVLPVPAPVFKGVPATTNPVIPPHAEGPFPPSCTDPVYEYKGTREAGELVDVTGEFEAEAIELAKANKLSPTLEFAKASTHATGSKFTYLHSAKFCSVTYLYIQP